MNNPHWNASVNHRLATDSSTNPSTQNFRRNPTQKLEKTAFEGKDLFSQLAPQDSVSERPPVSVSVKSRFSKALFGSDSDCELNCLFTRVVNLGRPAVLARINICLGDESAYELSRLLRCIAELNVRLPRLKAGVCSDETGRYFLSLHGLSHGQINSENLSCFLRSVTRDLDTFFAYATAYGIQVSQKPS